MNYRAITCLALSVAAGWAGAHLGLPLAWVLGPLIVTAVFAMTDAPVFAPVGGRRLGQLIIGSSVGLNLTAPVLLSLIGWLPIMVVTSLISVLLAAALSVVFARVARLDQPTAYFAIIPGGMAEMANIGLSQGARPEPIAVSQALRVALVVCTLPPLIILAGGAIDRNAWIAQPPVPLEYLPLVLVFGAVGAMTLSLVRFQNPWMIGSLLGVSVLAATGLVGGRLPIALVNAGQFFLGIAIGARFQGDIVRHLARLSLISAGFTVVLTGIMAVYSAVVAPLSGISFSSMMLSTAPGGFAEMVVTAQVLHLQVTVVSAFHITRALIINGMALHIWAFLNRIGFFGRIDALLRRVF